MATTKKTTMTVFETNCLKNLNKDEKTLQAEKVAEFAKRSVIEIKTQIGIRQNKLANLELDLELANNELEHAKEKFETVRFSLAKDFAEYLSVRNGAKSVIHTKKQNIISINSNIEQVKEEIAEFNEILQDFN